ncbi:IS5 family transposase [filamentous cyanobacterium LEGE 11480]|uniref:IS5 family transposase n=1 Tax=Romeriopsis navalis LEGE 11480 TaxID=2777977 RepID=A0A928VTF1_9CYAN|nr:IS5 family transposase [Romeriopsis navalis]MBE9033398.1 IS5 family transposase [Romeriopsis navalis LEGE 11480]
MSYRIRNWSEYNVGLTQRGSLTFWLDASVISSWVLPCLSGRRGASQRYSDIAIATFVTVKSVYGLAGRQTAGFLASLLGLMGLSLPVPDHSTVSRRQAQLEVALPVVSKQGSVHVVVDSTGIKVYGEGEWKTRQHGISKRRTWRKLHLSVDEATGEILSAVVSTNNVHDSEVFETLIEQISGPIEQVSADGAYDQRHCYDAIAEREAKAGIPPQKHAKIWQHGNCKAPPHLRDENLRQIRRRGRKAWKRDANYHRRSLAETTMSRLKAIFGGKVRSRTFDNQAAELLLQCAALNRMIQTAKPDTFWVDD